MRRWVFVLFAASCVAVSFHSFACGAEIGRQPARDGAGTKSGTAPSQIEIAVRVLEVSRTKLRELELERDLAFMLTDEATGDFRFEVFDDRAKVDLAVKVMLANAGKIFAEPTLAGSDRQPLSFRSGGTVKVPKLKDAPDGPMQMIEYGTTISALPKLQENGELMLDLDIQVGELDPKSNVTVGTHIIPGVRRRRVNPSVTMRSGQTVVISGLRQSRVESQRKGNFLVGKTESRTNETDLVILVRPTYTPSNVTAK